MAKRKRSPRSQGAFNRKYYHKVVREALELLNKNPKRLSNFVSLGVAAVSTAFIGAEFGIIVIVLVALLGKIISEILATFLSSYLLVTREGDEISINLNREGDIG